VGLILFSYLHTTIQFSYAITTNQPEVRTLIVKVHLNKSIVQQGDTQTICFQVADEKTHQPISGAITSATVKYADGTTIRQFSAPTDTSGRSSISWKIERNAPLGSYDVLYSVFETGYVAESNFDNSFSVMAHGIALNKPTDNYYD
jgi:uncharacterized protein YfaS (alpha-2-macroglobulin family)